jgi:hypothetical protein
MFKAKWVYGKLYPREYSRANSHQDKTKGDPNSRQTGLGDDQALVHGVLGGISK